MRGTWQTTGGGSGGGLAVAVVIVAALAIGSGAVSAAVSALVTIAIVVACLAIVAVLGGVALLVYRAKVERGASGSTFQRASLEAAAPESKLTRSDRPGRPVESRAVSSPPPEVRPQLEESHKPAIE